MRNRKEKLFWMNTCRWVVLSAALLAAANLVAKGPAKRNAPVNKKASRKYGMASGADQVLSAVYDPSTKAIRVEGAGATGGSGTVNSIGLSMPSTFSVTGTPITSTGVLSVNWAQPVGIANGGTGQTSAAASFNALAPATLSGGLIYGTGVNTYGNLPLGANGQCLGSNGATLTWTVCGVGSTITFGGDLSGTSASQTVTGLQGHPVSAASPASGQVLEWNANAWTPMALPPTGTLTSVGLSAPSLFTVTGSPVTSSGTLTLGLASQSANLVFASPNGSSGAPAFRSLNIADLPTINFTNLTGTLADSQLPADAAKFAGAITAGDCAKWSSSGVVTDAGSACGSGGSSVFQVNGAGATTQTPINFQSGGYITVTNPNAGNIQFNFSGPLAPANGGTGLTSLGTSGQCLGTNGTVMQWQACATGGTGSPGGANTQVQFDNAGAFGGSSNLTWNNATNTLTVAGAITASSFQTIGTGAGNTEWTSGPMSPGSAGTVSCGANANNQFACSFNGGPLTLMPALANDLGGTDPTNPQVVGFHLTNEGETGNSPITFSIPNDTTTGTTQNELAKIVNNGGPGKAILISTSDTNIPVYMTESATAASGNARLVVAGSVGTCAFDGTATAGDYVTASSTIVGDCHDAGAALPNSGWVVGQLTSSPAAAGSTGAVKVLGFNASPGAGGTAVSSVALSAPSGWTVTGSPVTSSGTLTLTGPLTTTGDIPYSSSGSTWGRLPVGANGSCLTVASGAPSWGSCSGAGGYATIDNNGAAITQRNTLNVSDGLKATDDSTHSRSDIHQLWTADGEWIKETFIPAAQSFATGDYQGSAADYVLNNVAGTGLVKAVPATASMIGVWQVASGAASGNETGLIADVNGSTNGGIFPAPANAGTNGYIYETRFQLSAAGDIANDTVVVGLPDSVAGDPDAAKTGLWCEVTNTASAGTWTCKFQMYSGGFVSTTMPPLSTAPAADNNAHVFRWVVTPTTLDVYYDGTREWCANAGGTGGCAANTNLTTGIGTLSPGWFVKTNSAAAVHIDLDGWVFSTKR